MNNPLALPIVELDEAPQPTCSDYDADCAGVKDKVACWLYMPECGRCPYLLKTGE